MGTGMRGNATPDSPQGQGLQIQEEAQEMLKDIFIAS
jgi:hypothetical protein